MALDALSCNELLNFIIHDTISVTPYSSLESSGTTTAPAAAAAAAAAFIFETEHSLNLVGSGDGDGGVGGACTPSIMNMHCLGGSKPNARKATLGVPGRKRRRRRPKVCKNKEEEENQRMTHIAVERNRRKQMNEHLAALRSLMPESYVQRGDQASVVGGAIMFVKEMEHLLQSLETKKLEQKLMEEETQSQTPPPPAAAAEDTSFMRPPFSHFFVCPQYTWLQLPSNSGSKYSSTSSSSASLSSSRSSGVNGNDNGNGGGGVMAAIADIEVTLIETHANLRILSRRSPMQLSRLVAGFHTLQLSILHLNVITLHPLVLYSISAKVEEGCQLTTVDDISGAVHHMLRIIEEGESALC